MPDRQPTLFRMRAPSGEEQDVPSTDVGYYINKGATLLGPSPNRPASTAHPYADIAGGARAAAAQVIQSGGDVLRMGYNALVPEAYETRRTYYDPENLEATVPPNSMAGTFGNFAANAIPATRAFGAATGLARAANLGRAATLGVEAATGAGIGGLQTHGDKAAMVGGAALPGVLAVRGTLPTGGFGRAGKMATDAVLGGATGYAMSGGDTNMALAGAVGLPALTGGRAGLSAFAKTAGRVAEGAEEGGLGGAVAGFLRKNVPGDPWRMITQAVKPRNSRIDFEKNLPNIVPAIKHVAETAGMPLDTLDDVLAATKATKQAVRSQFDDAIGNRNRMVDMTPLADAQIAAIPKTLRDVNPGRYQQLAEQANAYRGRMMSLDDAELRLQEANAALEAHQGKFPAAKMKALRADPEVAMDHARAGALRDVIYGDNPALPTRARVLNRRYGQLIEFEDTLYRRKNVAERQQPESLSEQIGKVRAVGQAAKGVYSLAHGNPMGLADLAGARAGSAYATFLKEQQTTNALLKRAFQRIPGPGARRPVAGLIGEGARRMPPAPDTSGPIPGNGPGRYAQQEMRPGQLALPAGPEPVPPRNVTQLGPAPDTSYARGVPAEVGEAVSRPGQPQLPGRADLTREQIPLPGNDPSRVLSIPADIEGSTPYADFERAFNEEMGQTPAQTSKGKGGSGAGQTAYSFAAPLVAQAIPNDPESQWDDYAKLALNVTGAGAALGMAARTFDPGLKKMLDEEKAFAIRQQKAAWEKANPNPKPGEKFEVADSPVETHVLNVIRKLTGGNRRETERINNAYTTIPLPEKHGIDWDVRKPNHEVLDLDEPGTSRTTTDRTARGARFSEFTQKRMDKAFELGEERAKEEGWGDPRYLYNVTNGNVKAAVQLARTFGAMSPGQKTDVNSIQGVEVFIRSAMGETVEQILGKKVPDPSRGPGATKRVGSTLSIKAVRPSASEDNLYRIAQMGRIFQEKVEALSAAEVGITDKIPIDMWLMRALGAESDVTPGTGWYRLISEAVAKEATKRGETPFGYMAKVWMGIQRVADAETPSFSASLAKARLEEPIVNPAMQQRFVANPEKYTSGIQDKSRSEVGEVFPIATNPEMSYEAFLPQLHQEFEAGTRRDVLGKYKVVETPKPVTLAGMRLEAQAQEMADAMTTRAGRGPGRFILQPDGTTKWLPFPGFVEKSGNPRAYKMPKGAVVVKEYKPKNAPKKD